MLSACANAVHHEPAQTTSTAIGNSSVYNDNLTLEQVRGKHVDEACGGAHEGTESSVPKKNETLGPENPIIESRAIPHSRDEVALLETNDLEAVHRVPSGPAYSAFSQRQRKYIVTMVAFASFFSPLSANIYFPALTSISRDLRVSNELVNLSLTTYMIFQGLAPTVFGDLADMTGRRPVFLLGFIIYIGANVGLALQDNYVALLVLRCLQSTGSSGTVALGNGVVADIASSGERGKFMGTSGSFLRVKQTVDLG